MKLCSKCNKERPEIEFQGNRSWCSLCNKLYHKARYEAMKVTNKNVPVTKLCSSCNLTKSADEFARKCDSIDGLLYRCKDCDYKARGRKIRLKPKAIVLTTQQLAYLAGLLDGEGHIGLSRHTRTKGEYAGNHLVHVRCVIAMTTNKLFEIKDVYGFGTISSRKNSNPKHKDRHDWKISSNECRSLLPIVIPYLFVKKQQAELLLKYLHLANHRNRTEEYRQNVKEIYDTLKTLNKRGK